MKRSILGFALLLCTGCPPEAKEQPDGGKFKSRPECNLPSMNCYNDCFKRDASRYCPSCCSEQLIHCDEGRPYDFEPCKQKP